jgi:hypothetical protein
LTEADIEKLHVDDFKKLAAARRESRAAANAPHRNRKDSDEESEDKEVDEAASFCSFCSFLRLLCIRSGTKFAPCSC